MFGIRSAYIGHTLANNEPALHMNLANGFCRPRNAPDPLPDQFWAVFALISINTQQLGLLPVLNRLNGPINQISTSIERGIVVHLFYNALSSDEKRFLTILSAVQATARDLTRPENNALREQRIRRPRCLILVPTRAKAIEMYNWTLNLCLGTGLCPGVVYGTWSPRDERRTYGQQVEELLTYSCDILIGPPSRLLHLSENHYPLDGLSILCLDQAQAFIAESWQNDLFAEMRRLRIVRLGTSILAVASQFNLNDAQMLNIAMGTSDRQIVLSHTPGTERINTSQMVAQELHYSADGLPMLRQAAQKIGLLLRDNRKAIVYLNTKEDADRFYAELIARPARMRFNLNEAQRRVSILHSDKTQDHNERVLEAFLHGQALKILIGTQQLADLPFGHEATDIIHIGLPRDSIQYLARLGSIARFDNGNTVPTFSHAFFTAKDAHTFDQIALVVAEGGLQTRDEVMGIFERGEREARRVVGYGRNVNVVEQGPLYNSKFMQPCYLCPKCKSC